MSDKIELGKLCGVLQRKFLCLSQSESRTQPCHVRILIEQKGSSFEQIMTKVERKRGLIFYVKLPVWDTPYLIIAKKFEIKTASPNPNTQYSCS